MSVYKVINAVQADLAKAGIGKDSENTFDKYKFRGIDAVYNAIAPLLAKHGLCILPRMLSRTCEERTSQKGGALFYVTVEAEFDFVCAEDGTKHTVKTFGEAMDRGDKATNKAMSAAYKYAAFQAFAIPTEGDNDADASTHEVQSKPETKAPRIPVTKGAMEALTKARQMYVGQVAAYVIERFEADDVIAAHDEVYKITDDLELMALSSLIPSHIRTAIRKHHETTKETA
jgi:hypothetical protein